MKSCKKCGANIPARAVIEGRPHNLGNRLYCLSCSPFLAHNTRKLDTPNLPKSYSPKDRVCKSCGRAYVYDLRFKQGHKLDRCNSCVINDRRFALKVRAVEYKGGSCENCGYDKCLRALTFHHKDPSQKDWQISGNHCRKWESIKQELDKCVMLCSNCHAEVHADLDSKRRTPPVTVNGLAL